MTTATTPDFAKRLGDAVGERGLSLARIRDRLEEQGVKVSIATLSYWSSGRSRPTRSGSLEVVRSLEILLGTPPGWLVEAMPGPAVTHTLAEVLNRSELLSAAVEEYGLCTTVDWRTVRVQHHARIDAEGRERVCQNWSVQQAVSHKARGYTIVVEGHADSVAAQGMGMVHANRSIQVAEDLFVVEFLLDAPVARGQRVLVGDRIDFLGERPRCTGVGYALKTSASELTLQVSFDAQMPGEFTVTSQAPDQPEPVLREQAAMVGRSSVQTVFIEPGAGLHSITWA